MRHPLVTEPSAPDAARWRDRAAQLIWSLQASPELDVRLAILRKFTQGLGEAGFPQLLKLLLVIADSDDRVACQLIATTFLHALNRMELPSGVLSAWGASNAVPGQSLSALALQTGLGVAPRRRFGPIEYVTVWYGQKTQRPFLTASTCERVLAGLITLFNHSEPMARLYPAKILAELEAAPEGAYTRQTRTRLTQIALGWQQGRTAAELARAAVADHAASPSTPRLLKDL